MKEVKMFFVALSIFLFFCGNLLIAFGFGPEETQQQRAANFYLSAITAALIALALS